MDYKRAIEIVKDLDPRGYPTYREAKLMAIEALEKQVPMKPKKLTYKLLLDDGWIYECPTCGCACGENKYHPEVTKDDMYCTQCGQAIDWE